jgi:hypothetical protein
VLVLLTQQEISPKKLPDAPEPATASPAGNPAEGAPSEPPLPQ